MPQRSTRRPGRTRSGTVVPYAASSCSRVGRTNAAGPATCCRPRCPTRPLYPLLRRPDDQAGLSAERVEGGSQPNLIECGLLGGLLGGLVGGLLGRRGRRGELTSWQ